MSRTLRWAAALCALLVIGAGCASPQPDAGEAAPATLRMGLPPADASPDLLDRFRPLTDLVQQGAGRPVEVTRTSDYLAIVEAMRSGLLDVAAFSPFPTPLAQEVAGVVPLVVARGAPYSSVLVCRTDRGISAIEDIRGRTVAFVDPGSTSGNYIPRLMLSRAGINPETDIEGTFAGGHDSGQLAVQQGSADCAADARTSYEAMVAQGVIDPAVQAVVAESDPIPVSLVIIARPGLDPAITEGIIAAFTENPDPAALGVVRATSFTRAQDSDFAIFREAAEELGVELDSLGS